MDKLFIHNIAWGPFYRKMLFNYCIPALADDYKRLVQAGIQVEWIVHVDDASEAPVFEGMNIQVAADPNIGSTNFFRYTREVVQISVNQDAYIALIAPDSVFAQGSLYNAYMLARHKDTSVAIAHPRVQAYEFMEKMGPGRTYGARELVALAMQDNMMHPALRFAFDDLDQSITNQGVSIRRLSDTQYAVVHTLPSGILFKFNQSDADYLKGHEYGEIDRGLNRKLFAEQRIKLVGSSDVCFFVELTRPDCNFHGCVDGMRNNDRHVEAPQNIWNNSLVIWGC